ncbi:MAG: helix-turn-helix transcriptional regulator [Clostridiaceae bacterium]|nr:helix-turn-helix transcriptional regulator [Clostridiaceae bacterium]
MQSEIWYQKEYRFMESILKKQNIQINVLKKDKVYDDQIDFGIREILGRESEYNHMFYGLPFESKHNTIYKITDPYMCNYFYLMLPQEDPAVVVVGPYMSIHLTRQQLLEEMERFSTQPKMLGRLENYYSGIPVINDEIFLFTTIICFAEVIWGGSDSFNVVKHQEDYITQSNSSDDNSVNDSDDILQQMEQIEHRYAYENELLEAVTLGLSHKAELMLSHLGQISLRQRVSDTIRNLKNYGIIMNTLMRKAAEKGSVHPMYLDRISTEFAKKIEMIVSMSTGYKLMSEIISSYCRLVNKHNSRSCSLPIHKTLICIDANLASDLTLHTLASMQNISAGYLSSLFKKEMGCTLTEYVNRKRMKYAVQLLTTTLLQVQTISQYCGIQDLNYFSKVFKHYYECTPTEYRQMYLLKLKH